ncbi:MAG TPA: NADP-dependent malic enzyme [Pirellulales bacterium]|nr:NADP-dependent malic enzyme [Pirellulales bacterium]
MAPGKLTAKAVGTEETLHLHRLYRGKVQTIAKCPLRGFDDFSIWYTPGIAEPCREIQRDPTLVYDYTNKGNTIAIVSDGTRVLGLGNIGPDAGLPVMEGKALLFKFLGGVDAVPLCLRTHSADELVQAVKWTEPSFGAVNLEDIAHPTCFRVLDRLRREAAIPVWHDDQQGTATVVLAALLNALKVVDKRLENARIAMIGIGAANFATYRLLTAAGANRDQIVACDRCGTLHPGRRDIDEQRENLPEKWHICQATNAQRRTGGIAEALRAADVCLAFSSSGPGILRPEWIREMAPGAIVFACANPIPEIWPQDAKEAGARVVATGRGDFPNQVNNSLGFPAIFRGVLDVRATTISDRMALAAARELAAAAGELTPERIVPRMDEWEIYPRVAAATAMEAQREGVAHLSRSRNELMETARRTISTARQATFALMREGLIPAFPAEGC